MNDVEPWPEEELQRFYARSFTGRFRGMTSYPHYDNERNRAIHAACLELERRGLIRRFREEPDCVVWENVT